MSVKPFPRCRFCPLPPGVHCNLSCIDRMKQLQATADDLAELGPVQGGGRPAPVLSPDQILEGMAATFKNRNAIYKDNYKMIGPIVAILFPNGVPAELVISDKWHLFDILLTKLTRFAVSELTHRDSIHDLAVFAAMIESCLQPKEPS